MSMQLQYEISKLAMKFKGYLTLIIWTHWSISNLQKIISMTGYFTMSVQRQCEISNFTMKIKGYFTLII